MIGTIVNTMCIIVGGVLITASGLSILKLKDCKVLNMIPALAVPPLFFVLEYLFSLVMHC